MSGSIFTRKTAKDVMKHLKILAIHASAFLFGLYLAVVGGSPRVMASELLRLDEVSAGVLGGVCQQGAHVLLGVFDPLPKLYVFDFQTRKVRELKDGRLPRILMGMIPYKYGFAIFDGSRFRPTRVFMLDSKGDFLKSKRFNDFPSLARVSLVHVAAYQEDALITYELMDSDETMRLAVLDLGTMALTELATMPRDPQHPQSVWVSVADTVYWASPFRGLITRVTDAYEPSQAMTSAEPLQLSRSSQKMATTETAGHLAYRPLLSNLIDVDGAISFARIRKTDDTVTRFILGRKVVAPKMLYRYFLLSPDGLVETPLRVVAHLQGVRLVFSNEDEAFSIIDEPAKP